MADFDGRDESGRGGPSVRSSDKFLATFLHTWTVQLRLAVSPASGTFYFLGKRRNQPLSRFVPDLCQRIADLDVLDDLERRKNSKLRVINSGRGTDSVPGHQILKHLLAAKNISF